MRRNIEKAIGCGILILILIPCGRAQTANGDSLLGQSFHAMYNLQFEEAFRKADQAKALDKTDPMPWVAQATAVLFREFDRLHILRSEIFTSDTAFDARPSYTWNPEARKQFEDSLATVEKLARGRLEHDKNDVDALFAMVLMNGLRANEAALIAKHNMTSLSFTKASSGYAERLLAISPSYYDAYISTGMSEYLVGTKPAPVRWILRLGGFKGNQEEGVKELTLVSERGKYMAPFARILLAFNDLRHKNPAEARKKLAWLHDQFPANPLYTQEMAKCDHPSLPTGQ